MWPHVTFVTCFGQGSGHWAVTPACNSHKSWGWIFTLNQFGLLFYQGALHQPLYNWWRKSRPSRGQIQADPKFSGLDCSLGEPAFMDNRGSWGSPASLLRWLWPPTSQLFLSSCLNSPFCWAFVPLFSHWHRPRNSVDRSALLHSLIPSARDGQPLAPTPGWSSQAGAGTSQRAAGLWNKFGTGQQRG